MSKSSRSGTTLTYAARLDGGRPTISVTATTATIELMRALGTRLNLNRSALIELAIREFAKRYV